MLETQNWTDLLASSWAWKNTTADLKNVSKLGAPLLLQHPRPSLDPGPSTAETCSSARLHSFNIQGAGVTSLWEIHSFRKTYFLTLQKLLGKIQAMMNAKSSFKRQQTPSLFIFVPSAKRLPGIFLKGGGGGKLTTLFWLSDLQMQIMNRSQFWCRRSWMTPWLKGKSTF